MRESPSNSENLRREITYIGLVALTINGMIGAGIFALPANAAAQAGAFSPWMFVLCALLFAPIVLALGQAASYFHGTGGPVLYVQTAFGSFAGFQTGWLLTLGRISAFAANCNALMDYGGALFPVLGGGTGRFIAITAVCLVFTTVNVIGVKQGMRTTNFLTVAKLLPIVFFVALGIFHLKPSLFQVEELPVFDEFSATLLLLMYAFVGFEGALVPAGESKNPQRDLPRAIAATLGFTALLYVLIQTVCLSLLPNLSGSNAPLADAAGVLLGPAGVILMTAAAFLSIAGNLSSIMVTAPRMTYTLAQDRALPAWFGAVHPKNHTPAGAIIFLGITSYLLAVTGSFIWLAIISSLSRMLMYALSIATLPILARKFGDSQPKFRYPGIRAIALLAFLLCLWLSAQADLQAWLMTIGFAAAGTLLFLWSKRAAKSPNNGTR